MGDTTEALSAATAAVEGKMSKSLKKLLKKVIAEDAHEKLAVADAKLGGSIQEKMDLSCVYDSKIGELMRCIRSQISGLISGLPDKEMGAMALGLAHSLSRYKLKFSPDKVDTMIVQAISLLDDLDKELNNYVMRVREWYGWHFPEMGKVVTDNLAYAKTIIKMKYRVNCSETDFSDILPEDIEEQVKELAEVSMGTDISEDDLENILALAEQVVDITGYRAQLFEYLKNRMAAIAPNLTVLLGELVGARLIAHAGSLLNLAKHPTSPAWSARLLPSTKVKSQECWQQRPLLRSDTTLFARETTRPTLTSLSKLANSSRSVPRSSNSEKRSYLAAENPQEAISTDTSQMWSHTTLLLTTLPSRGSRRS